MKWFDSLFSDKSSETSLKSQDDVTQNHSHTSYRDIKKRSSISLVQGIFDTRKSFTPFSLRKKILRFCEAFPKYLKTLTRRHWFIVALLLLLAYIVYGIGFIIRTERHLDTLREEPGDLFTRDGFRKLRAMKEDYQIMAPFVQNPIFPIEPLATYGRALNILYGIVTQMDTLADIESDVMQWRDSAEAVSIFPIMDETFSWLRNIDPDIRSLHAMVQ